MHLHRQQPGLTLIELMIAMAIGMVLTLAVAGAYVNANRNFTQDENYSLLQENGRYALKVLSQDLLMTDFWGKMMNPDLATTALAVPAGDCGIDISLFDASSALQFNNYHELVPVEQFAPCATITDDLQPNTDVLVVKRVAGAPEARTFVDHADEDGDGDTTETLTVGAGTAGAVYLRTNGTSGTFIDDSSAGNVPLTGESDWAYRPHVYFVRDFLDTAGDGIPTLCRLQILGVGLGPPQCIAEGIENVHYEFGVDTDGDGIPNQYLATPTTADMEDVTTVRIWVLARSASTIPHYTNAKSYVLGDVAIPAANDGFYRRVYTTTVSLRNSAAIKQLN